MPETLRRSFNGFERARVNQPLPQSAELIPASDCEREVDIFSGPLSRDSSFVVQVKVARESPHYDARDSHRIECSRYICRNLCMQTEFTSQ